MSVTETSPQSPSDQPSRKAAEESLRVLMVEDEAVFATAVRRKLRKAGYRCETVFTLAAAEKHLKEVGYPDLLLLDMRLPDGSGLNFLEGLRAREEGADLPVLVMSAYGEIEDAVSAMKLRAADYLKKPVDLEELLLAVNRLLDVEELKLRLDYSAARARKATGKGKFIGESKALKIVRKQVARIHDLLSSQEVRPPTILISGETGTGKDVLARMLSSLSVLSDRPFVHVDCASLPKELIEAELFGHEKGAFTSAHAARVGLIEAAEDGALFLDEIGELPLSLQAKFLAVLERRMVRRIGASRERKVRAWLIAATNCDLEEMVKRGEFRSDLFYRLNVLRLHLPPLRERGDDILLLAQHFATQSAERYHREPPGFSPEVQEALRTYHWPGNVRELKHSMERAVLLGGRQLSPASLGLSVQQEQQGFQIPPGASLEEAECMIIQQCLERNAGNVSQSARELGITRMVLRTRLEKLKLR